MRKDIDIKNRIVNMYDVNTGTYEDEIANYLDKNMKVIFHSAHFSNSKYVFIRKTTDQTISGIMVSSYRAKQPGENVSVSYQ